MRMRSVSGASPQRVSRTFTVAMSTPRPRLDTFSRIPRTTRRGLPPTSAPRTVTGPSSTGAAGSPQRRAHRERRAAITAPEPTRGRHPPVTAVTRIVTNDGSADYDRSASDGGALPGPGGHPVDADRGAPATGGALGGRVGPLLLEVVQFEVALALLARTAEELLAAAEHPEQLAPPP